ncbi:hypothetical protein C8A01DRAFT_20024 [Parachaetomium inaequale]|uniref:2EXR domain-containing protein n=1 Tax=Parachaetomium inaequale TaxID=2588326 RepID=A0AAN6P755_9PEZI|nr:hypothetical protein C8A01DRAFT_20024 [Parachaetomium inaequale]
MAPAFSLFQNLPLELRQLIWYLAIPDDEPEVCILQKENLEQQGQDNTPEPMTVDTAFPALMHACYESRNFVLRHSGLRFRCSPKARCEVPFRSFRPELDTLFWYQDQLPDLLGPRYTASQRCWLSELRHLAIASSGAYDGDHTETCIMSYCPKLRTFSVVFADSTDNTWACRVVKPEGRYKLQRIYPDRAEALMVLSEAHDDWITLKRFLLDFCGMLNTHAEYMSELPETWTGQENLLCFAQTFVEWSRGEWAEPGRTVGRPRWNYLE